MVRLCVYVPTSAGWLLITDQWGGITPQNFGSWGDGDAGGRLYCGSGFIPPLPPPAKLEAAVQPRPTSEKLLSGGKMSSAPVPAPQQAGSLLQPLC